MKSLTKQEEQILLIIHHLKNKAYLVNIREKIKEITGNYLDVGTIYVPLKRLTLHGFLDASLGEPTAIRGGKAIKYYSLTPKAYNSLAESKRIQDRLWKGVVIPAEKG
jgi:DNA-binding PadR family transcriptional regulator